MVVRQKLLAIHAVKMKHLLKDSTDCASSRLFECDVRCSADTCYCLMAIDRGIRCGDFVNGESLRGCFYQCRHIWSIVSVSAANFNAGHDVGFHAAHEMNLDPVMHVNFFAVLRVEPSNELTGRETRRINGKVSLDSFHWQAALYDKLAKDRSERGIFKVVENRVVVRESREVSVCVCFFQIDHETTARDSRVDLECGAKNHVGIGEARASLCLDWLADSCAQVPQESLKVSLFVCLSRVVAGPVLSVGDPHSFGFGSRDGITRCCGFTFNRELNGIDMLAFLSAQFEVRAN